MAGLSRLMTPYLVCLRGQEKEGGQDDFHFPEQQQAHDMSAQVGDWGRVAGVRSVGPSPKGPHRMYSTKERFSGEQPWGMGV